MRPPLHAVCHAGGPREPRLQVAMLPRVSPVLFFVAQKAHLRAGPWAPVGRRCGVERLLASEPRREMRAAQRAVLRRTAAVQAASSPWLVFCEGPEAGAKTWRLAHRGHRGNRPWHRGTPTRKPCRRPSWSDRQLGPNQTSTT
ncbi:unnamed protein product [Prorocentrum cordatum]|uniref:Uncharacterized protein n=1 Tax=Prorocentrum cordatum TaxID=2364126 RepID=A0ABN9PVP8_9DINO|nr:unnamed protein product [Polarella glacialis]